MKHTYMTLAIIAALSLTACGGSDDKDMVKDKDTSTGSTQDHNQDQDKDKNKDKDQGNKGSAGSSSAGSSASSSSASSNYGASPAIKKLFAPPPAALSVDAEPLPVGDNTALAARKTAEGNGPVVVWWDSKFKAMNSVNRSLGNSLSFNQEDGTREYLDASWNKVSITAPNDIVGHDGVDLDNTDAGEKKVAKSATIDLLKAQLRRNQNLTIKLKDGSEAKIQYQAKVFNLGHQDGNYVAQAVHVFGKELTENGAPKPIDMTYIYGEVSPGSFTDATDTLPTEPVKYEGIASYIKHDNHKIYPGTASFKVKFDSGNSNPTISDGKIHIPAIGLTHTHQGAYNTNEKTSFQTDPNSTDFKNSRKFQNYSTNPTDIRLRGRFYGKNFQYLGGTFYNNEGAGTFFTGDKERGGEVNAQGRR